MSLKIVDCHNCNTIFNTNKYIEYDEELKETINKANLYDEVCKMINGLNDKTKDFQICHFCKNDCIALNCVGFEFGGGK